MDCIEINETIFNECNVGYLSDKSFSAGNILYFRILEFKQIDCEEIDNLEELSKKIPLMMGKLFLLKIVITNADKTIRLNLSNFPSWSIEFNDYGNEDLCIEDEDGCKYETINLSFYKYCPLFHNKHNLSVGANNPIRTFMFLLPNDVSKLFIGLNNVNVKLSVSK